MNIASKASKIELGDRVLFAIPKKGRLYEKCVSLLKDIDVKFVRRSRLDVALSTNLPVALIFLPAADIAKFVALGRVDMGITGLDIIQESGSEVDQLTPLQFGACRLCVQAPRGQFKSPQELAGKRVVTSFPQLARQYFEREGIDDVSVHFVSGSVEVACTLGLADAVVDLVESGETMMAAGLEIVDVILRTEATLIANKRTEHREFVDRMHRRIMGVLVAAQYVLVEYNVERANLTRAIAVTPGRKAPTVSPLEDDQWAAVKAMVPNSDKHAIMDKLHDLGAVDILITTIHNCRV